MSPSPLTFTTTTWSTEQTVTVSAGQDDDAANDMATLTHVASGADYGSVDNAILTVTVTDNDTRGVTVTPTSLTVNEGGTNTYTVVLDTQPTGTVTVTIVEPTDNMDVTADLASLSFSTTDWATEQTVTVSAAEDDDSTHDTATVTHTVSGGDYGSVTRVQRHRHRHGQRHARRDGLAHVADDRRGQYRHVHRGTEHAHPAT